MDPFQVIKSASKGMDQKNIHFHTHLNTIAFLYMSNKRNKRMGRRKKCIRKRKRLFGGPLFTVSWIQFATYSSCAPRLQVCVCMLQCIQFWYAEWFQYFSVYRTRTHCLYAWKHAEHGIHMGKRTIRIHICNKLIEEHKKEKMREREREKTTVKYVSEGERRTTNDETKKNWNFLLWRFRILNNRRLQFEIISKEFSIITKLYFQLRRRKKIGFAIVRLSLSRPFANGVDK